MTWKTPRTPPKIQGQIDIYAAIERANGKHPAPAHPLKEEQMPPLPIVRTKVECDCGDVMRWRRRFFRKRWRLECVCGRCGPWRSQPETKPVNYKA
jgi:hypothetical protein